MPAIAIRYIFLFPDNYILYCISKLRQDPPQNSIFSTDTYMFQILGSLLWCCCDVHLQIGRQKREEIHLRDAMARARSSESRLQQKVRWTRSLRDKKKIGYDKGFPRQLIWNASHSQKLRDTCAKISGTVVKDGWEIHSRDSARSIIRLLLIYRI